ncbi:MAG: hypothetical protein K2F79_03170, partial [Muribaculaceae bacterium]|nr:hypothetical protein [Muribaculaceae bacterium]
FDPADLRMMFPGFDTYLAAIPAADDVLLEADVDGTTGRLDVSSLDLRLNNCVHLGASGWVGNVMQPDLLSADISLKGSIINVNSFKNRLLAPATAKTLNVPPMTLNGHVGIVRGTIDGRLTAATGKGRIKMDARWNGKAEAYKATVATAEFPVQAFMPLLGVDEVTALIRIDGRGYDPMKKSTRLTAQADISKAVYNKVAYTDISAKATLEEGQA